MKIMPCPLNGPRNITEFYCHGPVKVMPARDAPAEAWADYAFLEDNIAGRVVEWWFHIPTAYWFIAERDTLTDEIIRTWTVDAFSGEGRL
jgi:sarcosine oxidase, subunit delta